MGMPIANFALVAFDCPDPLKLAEFYQKIVGGSIKTHPDVPEWVRLQLPNTADIAFQEVSNYQAPEWPDGNPQQAHMDFDVPDLDAGEASVLSLGATKSDTQPDPDSWRVFLDPAGHPFCLIKT